MNKTDLQDLDCRDRLSTTANSFANPFNKLAAVDSDQYFNRSVINRVYEKHSSEVKNSHDNPHLSNKIFNICGAPHLGWTGKKVLT